MWLKKLLLSVLIIVALIVTLWLPKPASSLDSFLLCPVCSGQSVFESNHPIAIHISHLIALWQQDGLSSAQIVNQLQTDYGENITALDLVVARTFVYILLFIAGLKYAYQKKH